MFEKLTLTNFQKHKKLEVEFDECVTTIVGPTDSGKSAVLRALGLVVLNRPSGADFVRHRSGVARVTLEVDGHTVRRIRGEGQNTYSLDNKEFAAFRDSVPDSISGLLALGEINFQRQLDPPFWFTETAGQVSRNLNQIVNLGKIDDVLSKIASEVSGARATVKVCEARLASAREERDGLTWAEDMDRDLNKVELLFQDYTGKRARTRLAARLLRGAVRARRRHDRLSNRVLGASKCLLAARRAAELATRADKLVDLVGEAERLTKVVGTDVPDISRLDRVRKDADAKAEKVRVLEMLIREATLAEEDLCRAKKDGDAARKLLEKRSGGICPVCGRKLR